MTRTLFSLLLVVTILAAPLPGAPLLTPAHAAMSEVPLVVIRFNQRKVFYEKPLYNAVAKAVNVKPGVVFHLISYVPETEDEHINLRLSEQSARQAAEVAGSPNRMGVPRSRISLNTQQAPDVKAHEVHIFVE